MLQYLNTHITYTINTIKRKRKETENKEKKTTQSESQRYQI